MLDREQLFSEPKPKVDFPVDLDAEIRAKGKDAKEWYIWCSVEWLGTKFSSGKRL